MARKPASDIVELLARAEADVNDVPVQKARPQQAPQRPAEPAARRIYNGDPQSKTPGYAARPANKKTVTKKRRSTFNVVTVLFCSAVAIILYIGNILTVNQLAVEVHQLQAQYDSITNKNKILETDISQKSNRDRIIEIAEKNLGLVSKGVKQGSFEVDEGKLKKFKDK